MRMRVSVVMRVCQPIPEECISHKICMRNFTYKYVAHHDGQRDVAVGHGVLFNVCAHSHVHIVRFSVLCACH